MEVTQITKRKFNSLKTLELSSNIFNVEAKMYMLPTKDAWSKKMLLLKRLYLTNGEVFSNKLYTINTLIEKKDEIDIPELIFPKSLAVIDKEIVGFTMPYIPNWNFQNILDSNRVTIEQKTAYLKEIGIILEKMKNVRTYTGVNDFYLNDIHENNFILNQETGKINVVDLDSAKIGNNLTFGSRYLTNFSELPKVPKYKKLTKSVGGIFVVDDNTEIYCYIIMILNLFFGSNIGKISITDYYVYLDYLKSIGISYDLVDKLSYIYSGHPNENPYEHLDELASVYPLCHENAFKLKRQK